MGKHQSMWKILIFYIYFRRWPRTLAGMVAFYPCRAFALSSLLYAENGEEPRAWRKCDRNGRWAEQDYSECPFTHEVTRHLHAFSLVIGPFTSLTEHVITIIAHQ